jgi:hypothetical protein
MSEAAAGLTAPAGVARAASGAGAAGCETTPHQDMAMRPRPEAAVDFQFISGRY